MRRRDAVRSLLLAMPAVSMLAPATARASGESLAAGLGRAIMREHPGFAGSLRSRDRDLPGASGLGWRIRNDFSNGRTLLVRGWCLSYTEAAVCVLAARTSR